MLADILAKRYGAEVTLISEIGPVIGSHAGAGTLALFFVGRHRKIYETEKLETGIALDAGLNSARKLNMLCNSPGGRFLQPATGEKKMPEVDCFFAGTTLHYPL